MGVTDGINDLLDQEAGVVSVPQLKIAFRRPCAGGATTVSYNNDDGGQLSVRFTRAEAAN